MRVRCREKCFIDNRIYLPGDEFDYTGEISQEGPIVAVEESSVATAEAPKPQKPKGVKAPPGTTAAFLGQDAIDPREPLRR